MDGFDEQIDQVIGQRPAAQMHERSKPSEPGRLRVPAELIGGLCGDAPVAFPGPACRVVPVVIIELRAKLLSYTRDSPLIDFCWLLGKPSVCPAK
jgi:hypothetical protein